MSDGFSDLPLIADALGGAARKGSGALMKRLRQWALSGLALTMSLFATARPIRFTLDIWKNNPGTYALEVSNYVNGQLLVKKKLTIAMAVERKYDKVNVLFRPSGRQVIEASRPELMQPSAVETMLDAFLYENPIALIFSYDNSVQLNIDKNMANTDKFFKRYLDKQPADSPARQIPLDAFKQEVYVSSQGLMGLFVNTMIFGAEFEEGRSTYNFPEESPIREAVFELTSTLYSCILSGEASVLDESGKVRAKNLYRFEFSPELDVVNLIRMETSVPETQMRTVILLTR